LVAVSNAAKNQGDCDEDDLFRVRRGIRSGARGRKSGFECPRRWRNRNDHNDKSNRGDAQYNAEPRHAFNAGDDARTVNHHDDAEFESVYAGTRNDAARHAGSG
jgi:hypothetical protein